MRLQTIDKGMQILILQIKVTFGALQNAQETPKYMHISKIP